MLPIFPQFKLLELSDRESIQKITNLYPPYSDFNFTSLWSWDVQNAIKVSILNDNLVIRMTDYLNGEPFFSYLGTKKVNSTVKQLLNFAISQGVEPCLKLVPEVSVKGLNPKVFIISEERDHFDYIYEIKKVSGFIGSEYSKHRRLSRHFEKNNTSVRILDLTNPDERKLIYQIIEAWADDPKVSSNNDESLEEDFKNEFMAIDRLFASPPEFLTSLTCLCLFLNEEPVGFIINEKVGNRYGIAHFGKARNTHKGINPHLFQQNALTFLDIGLHYWNDQQDLGLPGLRYSKTSYRPKHFLKKYSLRYQE